MRKQDRKENRISIMVLVITFAFLVGCSRTDQDLPGQLLVEYNNRLLMLDGSGKITLQFDFEAGGAQWSPDGQRIKFWNQEGDLEILDLNTKQRFKLSIDQLFYEVYASDWSPDGKEIALVGHPSSDGSRGVYVTDVRESPDPRLVWKCEYECNDLHWLSSKEQIAISENLPATDSHLSAQIVEVNIQTGESTMLFSVDAGIAAMNWSPDETQVAIASYRKGIFTFNKNGEQRRMIAIDGGGGNLVSRQYVVGDQSAGF